MNEQPKIRVIFTAKSDKILADIIKNYNINENAEQIAIKAKEGKPFNASILIRLAKNFARELISENDLNGALEKEIGLSAEIANKVTKEIITNLVPSFEKASEDNFNDSNFQDEISKKITGEATGATAKRIDETIFPNIKPLPENIEVEKRSQQIPETKDTVSNVPTKKPRAKKIPSTINNEETVIKIKKNNGPDSYREPIE